MPSDRYQVELYDLSMIRSVRDRLLEGRWDADHAKIMSEALTQLLERAVVMPDDARRARTRGERAELARASALGFAAGAKTLAALGPARYDDVAGQLARARGDRWNRAYVEGFRRAGVATVTSP